MDKRGKILYLYKVLRPVRGILPNLDYATLCLKDLDLADACICVK